MTMTESFSIREIVLRMSSGNQVSGSIEIACPQIAGPAMSASIVFRIAMTQADVGNYAALQLTGCRRR
jgi:hypothetical protein